MRVIGVAAAAIVALAALAACSVEEENLRNVTTTAREMCAKNGGRPIVDAMQNKTDIMGGSTIGMHAFCVHPGDPGYDHPGLEVGIDTSRSPSGALVLVVIPGSAGERAGLKRRDVIYAVNDKPVATAEELVATTSHITTATTVTLKVHRGRQDLVLTALL